MAFFHFLKYLLLSVFLFLALNLFRSNLDTQVSVKFDIPLVNQWETIPLSLNYFLLLSFCLGIVFAGFLGALRLLRRNKPHLPSTVSASQPPVF